MIRFLAVFVALFAAALVCLSLLPNPPKMIAPASAVAAQPGPEAEPAVTQPSVRVVYPASGTSGTDVSVRTASVDTAPAAVAPASLVPPAAANAGVQSAAPLAVAVTPGDATAQAGTPGLNLNTASVDALNGLPGAGRIGRTIASHRPYRSVEDLLTKRVVRKSVYDSIKDQVVAE